MGLVNYTAEIGTESIKNAFQVNFIQGFEWIPILILTYISILLVTRELQKQKILALPMYLAWGAIGIPTHYIITIILALFYIIETGAVTIIGNVIGKALTPAFKESYARLRGNKIKLAEETKIKKSLKREKKREENKKNKIYIQNRLVGKYTDLGYSYEEALAKAKENMKITILRK